MLNYELTEYDLELIEECTKFEENSWLVSQHVYEDIIACLKLGYRRLPRYLVDFKQLYAETARKFSTQKNGNYEDILKKVFEARRDIIEFAEGDLLKDLRRDRNLTYDQKVKLLLLGMEQVLKDILKPKDQPQVKSIKDVNKSSTPYKTYGNLLSNIVPPTPNQGIKAKSSFSNRAANEEAEDVLENVNKDRILDLIKKIYKLNANKLFKLAQNFNLSLKGSEKIEYKEVKIGDSVKFRKMRNIDDLLKIRKQDWALPEEVFDVKLMKKNFLIEQPTKKVSRTQLIYVLADASGSMSDMGVGIREGFMKAILVSLGRNAIESRAILYFRFFNSLSSPLYKLQKRSEWFHFMNQVLDKRMTGGTDINVALHDAARDIEETNFVDGRTEIVLITDGTEFIDPDEIHEKIKVPIHAVLLEMSNDNVIASYTRAFTSLIVSKSNNMEEAMKDGLKLMEVI